MKKKFGVDEMLTRKHFREIAKILNQAYINSLTANEFDASAKDMLEQIVEGLCLYFKYCNPRFQRYKFIDAVYKKN